MAKIKKNAKRKKFQYGKNRKRVNNNAKKLPKTTCKLMKDEWNYKKSAKKNMKEMGLVFDLNTNVTSEQALSANTSSTKVANILETDANAPRARGYRLPRNQVEFLTELLDKYGEDYKKMEKDKKNYGQLTWRQFRRKVKEFKSIPEQYNKFLEHRKGKPIDDTAVKTPLDEADLW